MKKSIAILGSTGSIGKSLLEILSNDKKNFQISLLSANKNYKKLIKQAKLFNVKNLVITDKKIFDYIKKKKLNKKIKIYNNFDCFKIIFKKKNDFIMSAISGLEGLNPTLKSIKYTKKILIANKEAIICGWNLIKKEVNKYNTRFIPIDSEHFSIWSLLDNKTKSLNSIEKVYITASGGPFYAYPLNKFSSITPKLALNHPNWNMGKKISIDSSTMMNKVFEVIEAKNIFNIPYKYIDILLHPDSYLHAIVKFNNGITKLLIHDTSMKIPIFNSIYSLTDKSINSKNLEISKLNNFKLSAIDPKKFPSIKILKLLPKKSSLFETVLISANDELVNLFLSGKIKFTDITKLILKIIKLSQFTKYKKNSPKNMQEITELSKFVRLKVRSLCV